MEITLLEMLAARDARAEKQHQLLAKYHMPLVCFTMNIAGPVKNSEAITAVFRLGQAWLRERFIPVYAEEKIAPTGCEYYLVVPGDPYAIKQQTCQIETISAAGRLFDMDVLTPDGSKISREQAGLTPRRCLLCENDARVCGRSRAHSVEALQAETARLLGLALQENKADRIGKTAVKALVCEVRFTPKPGLVDGHNTGSHRDMDINTFLASAGALENYLAQCARIGVQTVDLPAADILPRLRAAGLEAEKAMYQATGGVNTHKGAIFTMGLLCAAAGRLDSREPAVLLHEAAAIVAGLCERDFAGINAENATTAGGRLYAAHGITGIRGQAEAGFPAIAQAGLPALENGLEKGLSWNDAGCATLLHLLCATEDTNMIARSDLATFRAAQAQIAGILAKAPYPSQDILEQLDAQFIEQNLSPGGTADLLAATCFLHFWKEEAP